MLRRRAQKKIVVCFFCNTPSTATVERHVPLRRWYCSQCEQTNHLDEVPACHPSTTVDVCMYVDTRRTETLPITRRPQTLHLPRHSAPRPLPLHRVPRSRPPSAIRVSQTRLCSSKTSHRFFPPRTILTMTRMPLPYLPTKPNSKSSIRRCVRTVKSVSELVFNGIITWLRRVPWVDF